VSMETGRLMSTNPQPQASTPSIRASDALVGGGGDDGKWDGRNEGKMPGCWV